MTPFNIEELDQSGDLRTMADDAGAYDHDGTRRDLLRKAGIGGVTIFGASAMLAPLDAFAAATSSQKGAYSTSGKKSIKRGGVNANDVKIGNYALSLEYIEAAFYAIAASKGYADPDIAEAATILAKHEQAHVDALKKVLGSAAVKTPAFNMDAVEKLLATQEMFISVASTIEPVGTAAYAGAGPYVQNIAIVKAALAIHSVEANHAAYTASLVKFKKIAVPAGVDVPSPVANTFNPAFTFAKTVSTVGSLGVVDGPLQP